MLFVDKDPENSNLVNKKDKEVVIYNGRKISKISPFSHQVQMCMKLGLVFMMLLMLPQFNNLD